ncbi:MAG: hypothetical protein EX271_04505 [Acidimicrobiales bacterium]|nr:hypothetical protein [Hyphomonadaceae bacterium]RZV43114.1 MAG: hypothetical protein EX271_04505 [Acidimicrobiales bacterium]
MKLALFILIMLTALIVTLHVVRWWDNRRAFQIWNALVFETVETDIVFDPAMVKDLPDPAKRFFLFTIKQGTPLQDVAEIETSGEIGLGPRDKPGYMPMQGVQIIAPPYGYVWRLTAGRGVMKLSGNEGAYNQRSWIRFWAAGTVPVVRAGDDTDHFRSAFGRMIADGLFWVPAALLPHNGAKWTPVDETTSRVTVSHYGLEQSIDITVTETGQPTQVVFQRWSDVNPDNEYRLQPFGGKLYDFKDFDGYTLPTRVEGGNHFGTDDYFPFYKAIVEGITFPHANPKNQNTVE